MQSNDPKYDAIGGADGLCDLTGKDSNSYPDRCGYGGRLPIVIISPWLKVNYVDHQLTDQTSILRFIEDNWNLGRRLLQSFCYDNFLFLFFNIVYSL